MALDLQPRAAEHAHMVLGGIMLMQKLRTGRGRLLADAGRRRADVRCRPIYRHIFDHFLFFFDTACIGRRLVGPTVLR